jgi:hypothetical protein
MTHNRLVRPVLDVPAEHHCTEERQEAKSEVSSQYVEELSMLSALTPKPVYSVCRRASDHYSRPHTHGLERTTCVPSQRPSMPKS